MKIRIQGNSIRYRLREPEVALFKQYGRVAESLQLGNEGHEKLEFVLQESASNEIGMGYTTNTTTIYIPKQMSERWTGSGLVGLDAIIEVGNGKALKILVEKDFKCLDGSDADNAGAYPNPNTHC